MYNFPVSDWEIAKFNEHFYHFLLLREHKLIPMWVIKKKSKNCCERWKTHFLRVWIMCAGITVYLSLPGGSRATTEDATLCDGIKKKVHISHFNLPLQTINSFWKIPAHMFRHEQWKNFSNKFTRQATWKLPSTPRPDDFVVFLSISCFKRGWMLLSHQNRTFLGTFRALSDHRESLETTFFFFSAANAHHNSSRILSNPSKGLKLMKMDVLVVSILEQQWWSLIRRFSLITKNCVTRKWAQRVCAHIAADGSDEASKPVHIFTMCSMIN